MGDNSDYYSSQNSYNSEYSSGSSREFEGYSSGSEEYISNPKKNKQEIMSELARLINIRYSLLKNDNKLDKDILLNLLISNEREISNLKYIEAGIDESLLNAELEFLEQLKLYNQGKINITNLESIKESLDIIRKTYNNVNDESMPLESMEYSKNNGTIDSMFDEYYLKEINNMKVIARKKGIHVPSRKEFMSEKEYSEAESNFYSRMLNYSPKENSIFSNKNKR